MHHLPHPCIMVLHTCINCTMTHLLVPLHCAEICVVSWTVPPGTGAAHRGACMMFTKHLLQCTPGAGPLHERRCGHG
jgi:hypothetical protein